MVEQDPQALSFQLAEWKPGKLAFLRKGDFTISRSLPDTRFLGAVQFSIRRRPYKDDVVRIDSYKEGYFAANWHSEVILGQFLDETEKFLVQMENNAAKINEGEVEENTIGFFVKNLQPSFYVLERPLIEEAIRRENLLDEADFPRFGLLRMDTPLATICFEPAAKIIGVMAWNRIQSQEATANSVGRFIESTQPVISKDIISYVLNRLPYTQLTT